MPATGSSVPPIYPFTPLVFLLPCALLMIGGILSDPPAPPPPAGVLTPAVVFEVQRDETGRAVSVLLRVDSADDFPVLCGIDRTAFPNGRLPAVHSQVTVDYGPAGCALPPSLKGQLPHWLPIVVGAAGLAAAIFWLWAGSERATRRRYRRTRERSRAAARVRAPGTGTGAAAGAPVIRKRRPAHRPR
ncbi:hypothetical protein AB0C02_28865 [Micromonospora sp. NPDC048999]|uniref:hypothetical protein n=1 Tax=Micromonospora sp. NPDC048999 TaxID=3155391 RepID=UPI0033EA5E97